MHWDRFTAVSSLFAAPAGNCGLLIPSWPSPFHNSTNRRLLSIELLWSFSFWRWRGHLEYRCALDSWLVHLPTTTQLKCIYFIMYSRRIVCQTTYWCCRQPPKLLSFNCQRTLSQFSKESNKVAPVVCAVYTISWHRTLTQPLLRIMLSSGGKQ